MSYAKTDNPRIRKFAITMTVALGLIGGLLFWWENMMGATVLWSISGGFLVLGFVLPVVLWPLERLWYFFSLGLGWFNMRVLLAVVFYGCMAPTGLIMRLFGKDMLHRRFDNKADTYWNDISDEPFDPENYERQY